MYLFWALSCTTPSLDERWRDSPDAIIQAASQISSLEQQQVLHWVVEQKPGQVHVFCAQELSEEVAYSCSLFENRPHLLEGNNPAPRSILHSYKPTDVRRTIQETFLSVQKEDSPQEIAKLCNAIADETLHAECFFVAADSFHHRKGLEPFQNMISLCLASGPFVSYCLSHIRQRMIYPSFDDADAWKQWDERFRYMNTHRSVDVRNLGAEFSARMAFRSVGELSTLCWNPIHEGTAISSHIQEALVFWGVYRQGERRNFFQSLSHWEEQFFPLCSVPSQKEQMPHVEAPKQIVFSGEKTLFWEGNVRPTHKDIEIDKALLLLESAYYFQDRFVVQDARKYPSIVVQERARKMLKILEDSYVK